MKKIITCILLSTISAIPFQSIAAAGGQGPTSSKSITDVYERAKTRSSGSLSRGAALRELRAQRAVSNEAYRHAKGTSASQAALVTDFHNMGITGKGVVVWLLEDSGVNDHADVGKYVDPASDMAPAAGFDQKRDHGAAMASLAHQIAPGAKLVVKHREAYKGPLGAALGTDIQPHVINASFNTGSEVVQSFFGPVFELDSGYRPLVVKSAGNDAKLLSEIAQYEGISDDLLNHLIVAGNLRQDGRPRASSGVPGGKKEIQDRFLWVIADDMLAAGGPTGSSGYRYITGTSGAAAILSGAASIIKSRHPHFTMKEVAECLLESANRDLFGLFGDGYHAMHVVEGPVEVLHEPAAAASSAAPVTESDSGSAGLVQTRTVYYNPAQWGKGVLNVRNAMLYADLKARSPRAKPEMLRRRMLSIVAEEQEEAAKLIQRWWREHKRTVPEHEKLLPMVVDPSIPDREYPEAEGIYRGARIAEPSPKEAGVAAGMSYSEGTHASAKKTSAEIREERQHAKDARKNTLDHLRSGSKSVSDVLSEIKEFSFDQFMSWIRANPGVLDYTPEGKGKNLLALLMYDYQTKDLAERILEGLFASFDDKNIPLLNKLVRSLNSLDYLSLRKDIIISFVRNVLSVKEKLTEGLAVQFLTKLLAESYGEDSIPYIEMYLAEDLPPLEGLKGHTVMHVAARTDIFESVLGHYASKGYPELELLTTLNEDGQNPFSLYAEGISFKEGSGAAIRDKLEPFLAKGAVLSDVGMQEMGSVIGTFIKGDSIESKKFNDSYYYTEADVIERRFLSLKNNAFIFDLEGFDKSPEKLDIDSLPEPVKKHILDNYSPDISAAGWHDLIDSAWEFYEGFLEANRDSTYSSTEWDGSKKEGPVREVSADGTVFYYTRYGDWIVG